MILSSSIHQLCQISLLLVSFIHLADGATSSRKQQVLGLEPLTGNFPKIITGLYGSPPKIQVHDPQGNASWSWDANTGLSKVPGTLRRCIQGGWSATEVKVVAKGTKIVAIIGYSAVVIKYTPREQDDKMVEFAVCLNGKLGNAHTVEMLPGNLLAIATTGQKQDAGIWVYDSNRMTNSPKPIQIIPGVRAIHGMLWDQTAQTLWAAGNTDAADGTGGVSYGIIQGYKYDQIRNRLTKGASYTMTFARQLGTEWEGTPFAKWWDGPHDLVPVPSQRVLLFPTDRDIHAINLSTGVFNHNGTQLEMQYLRGFRELGNRTGYNKEHLPRSDIKSRTCPASEPTKSA
ncbi:hypothetical protein EYZ11_001994 [Aspergillus tanneri]|uniref:Fucose-specific lectin n=1 Tax=Aspergillus tanneri TaxID=1220188 RepID=A0A4V3UQG0_9EURO|nr:hypothetical protein EYZ11_001994 [Aspergillus tanneri]